MSIALMAMAIEKLGYPVVSLCGWQVGMNTSSTHSFARIKKVTCERVKEELDKKRIVLVAGFQGVDKYGDVTTLGRGGSDTVMDAARSAGAGGGTVLHAKGTGRARAQKFFGVSLADEKDVVYIVAHADEKAAIMQAIADNAGPGTRAGAICFSLPISQVAGLRERDE